MTRTRLDRFGMAVAITVSLAGSITPTQATPLDIKPNDALEGITSMVFTNERRTALDLIGYLRYNCIKSIRVPGHRNVGRTGAPDQRCRCPPAAAMGAGR